MIRTPDYERGRFFISPILGCNAQCSFCYIYNKGYKTKIAKNEYSIEKVIDYLNAHDDFTPGRDGSIISIGAWGDPFPRYNKDACRFTLKWLDRLASFNNPIQIMSRYELHQEIIDGIVRSNNYLGHILYSTSISSISSFRKIERYTDNPDSRLKSLATLHNLGIHTNVMIKPFIYGITDLEAPAISLMLKKHNVQQCVVGDLLLDERIKKEFVSIGLESSLDVNVQTQQILDCTSGESYEIGATKRMTSFSNELTSLGIKVFKKSSCVNSYILNRPNPANYFNSDPNGFCIKCGVCK